MRISEILIVDLWPIPTGNRPKGVWGIPLSHKVFAKLLCNNIKEDNLQYITNNITQIMGCLIMFLKHDIGSIDCIIEIVKNNRNFLIGNEKLSKSIIVQIFDNIRYLSEKDDVKKIIYRAKLISSLKFFMSYDEDYLRKM